MQEVTITSTLVLYESCMSDYFKEHVPYLFSFNEISTRTVNAKCKHCGKADKPSKNSKEKSNAKDGKQSKDIQELY